MQNKRFKVIEEDRSWKDFQSRFRQLMDSHGYNLTDTANLLNISLTSISRYFKDRGPDILVLWRIADKFNVTIDWLVGRSNETANTLPTKAIEIANKYSVATEDDQLVIDTILKKYDI